MSVLRLVVFLLRFSQKTKARTAKLMIQLPVSIISNFATNATGLLYWPVTSDTGILAQKLNKYK